MTDYTALVQEHLFNILKYIEELTCTSLVQFIYTIFVITIVAGCQFMAVNMMMIYKVIVDDSKLSKPICSQTRVTKNMLFPQS